MTELHRRLSIVYINGVSVCIRDYPGEYDIENRRGWIEQQIRRHVTNADSVIDIKMISDTV